MTPAQVSVIKATPLNLPLSYEYAGRVAASKSVEVRARAQGILLERTYMEGARVEAGDLLFRIDPDTYKTAVAEARANLAKADCDWGRGSKPFQ